MKFIYAVFALSVVISSVSAIPAIHNGYMKRDVPTELIPPFGIAPGVNPSGTGNCDGIMGSNNQPIQIPCSCPPPREQFIADLNANVAAGHCINNTGVMVPQFPTDNTTSSQLIIFGIATVTLQNIIGPGVGCPESSTNWSAQAAAVQAEASSAPPTVRITEPEAPSSSAAPPSSSVSSSSSTSPSSSTEDTSAPTCSPASS